MPAHQTVLDVGVAANSSQAWLINKVLRGEYGFGSGLTISDCDDIAVLIQYRVAANSSQAAARALIGGVDQELQCGVAAQPSGAPQWSYTQAAVKAALADGLLEPGRLDAAVSHVLTASSRRASSSSRSRARI